MVLTANVQLVVVAVVVVSVFGTSKIPCTKETVNECLKTMLKDTGNDTGSPIVPTRTEEEMRKRCSYYKDFKNCLHPMKSNCGKVDRLAFEGIDNYYDYLCDQNFDEYLKHRECFKNGELHEEGKFCNSTFTSRMKNLRSYHYSDSQLRDRTCQYVEDYLDCVENVVTSFCGKEAARWQRGLDETSLMPLLSEIKCPGWTKKKPTLVAGLVGFFVLLLLIVGVLLVLKLRQTKKNNQRQTAPNEALQSPYGSAAVPYATYNGQDVYMYAGTPPPGANLHGAAVAGALPVKAPEYTESLPPAYDSAGYDNPVYGANQSDDFQSIPLERATASSNATAPPSVVPSQPDGNNDK